MRDERYAQPDRGGSDPPVAVMELSAEGVSDQLAPQAQLRAHGDHAIIRLDDGELSDAPFKSATS